MRRNFIAAVMAAALTVSYLPNIARAQQEETPVNNAVSGYVSLKDGVKIAGNNRTPKIYYDSADYEGVIRAIGDLKDDLYSVTGKEAVLEIIDNTADNSASDGNISVSSFQLLSDSAPVIAKLDLEAGEMTVDNYQSLAYEARGIIAFYNSESNVLEKVFLSENKATAQNGSLAFSNVEDIENTDIKGFLWRDDEGLTCEPAAGVYIYNRNIPEITPSPSAVPTGEPTVKPTGEPTDKPTLEPTDEPTNEPTIEPSSEPTSEPTNEPTIEPTSEPTSEPTNKPTAGPTTKPSEKPLKLERGDVVIGTFGENSLIDEFAKSNEAIANMEGKWESFTIQEIDGSIVIAGSDRRGTIYGIYDLCEKIGVSPWLFWADVQPETADELYINLPDGGYTEGEPSVKYRGIFPNDEYLLTTWSNEKLNIGTNMTSEKYEKVYELLLRLKLNTLWPAMHHYSTAFHKVNGAAQKADEYGIVIGSSHAEPLLRNNLGELYDFQQEWLARSENQDKTLLYQDSSGSYIKDDNGRNVAYIWTDKDNSGNAVANKEFLTDYWRESVKEYGEYENIYTLGMRGVHDTGFVTNMPSYTQAIAEVIAAQVDILEEVLQKDIDEIPTAFVAYKDVLEYYNRTGVNDSDGNEIVHLNIPESTAIMYCDDNFGYMRQTADEYERGTTGRAGVYYHLSYYGGPRSYLWLTSTQPGLIREELTKAHSTGSDKIWVVNVGDIKPAEKEIEYYARLARDVEGMNETDIAEVYAAEAKRDFNLSDSDAQVYAGIMDEYYALANSKRPEFYRASDTADGFNIAPFVYGDEAQRYLDRYNTIVAKAEILYEKLDDIKKDAFFETVLYPLRSSRNMAKNSLQTERANMSAEQGMGIASQRYAKEAEDAAAQITADTKYYNETVADGRWNGIMALQPKWGADAVIYYDGCDAKVAPRSDAKTLIKLDYTDMAIALEGKIADNPSINLSAYDSYAKYFDIVNTGYGSFDYAVTSDNEVIRLSKAEGTAYGSDRIYLTLDKSKATDNSQAAVTVTQLLDNNVINEKTIIVSISYPNVTDMDERAYYVESDSVVSVEAEHYSAVNNNDSYQWIVEKDFGRSGDTVKAYPDTANDAADNTYQTSSAYLEYDIYFTEAGTYTLDLYRMPTLNEGTTKMRCAVGLDDSAPIRLGGTAAVDGNSKTNMWGKQVLVNSEKLTATVNVSSAGKHTLKLYTVSTGFVADKIVLHRDNVYSYFGAPESYNSDYNNQIDIPTDAADTETDESGITKTFEPKAVIGAVTRTADKITVPIYALKENLSEAIVVAAGYDENGVMTSVDFKKVSFNEGEAQTELTLPANAENYAVTVIDGFTNMQVIAPYKHYGTIVTDAGSSYMKVATDLTEYESKKSAIIISDKAITEDIQPADIAYFYGGAITNTLYKSIPFTEKGEYNVRVGIDGEEPIDEAVSTVVNIEPDNNGAKITEYEQSFDDYTLNTSDWVLGTSCAKTSPNLTVETKSDEDKYLKLTQNNGSGEGQTTQTIGAYKIFDENDRVDIAANPNQNISADVMFGKMSGSGSWGTSQISIGSSSLAKSSAYFASNEPDYGAASDGGHILLMQYEGSTGKLTINGQLIAEGSNNFADKWINVSADADFTSKTMDATVTIEGSEPVIFKDLPFYAGNNINDIGSIYLRAAKPNGAVCIDNLEVYTITAPQYAISINAVDSLENQIEGAVITVKDEAGKTIMPEASGDFAGKYMLTKGTYTISASAFGYSSVTDKELVLNERLNSKTVTIELEKLPVQQYTVTFDLNGASGSVPAQTVQENGTVTEPSVPERAGYTFGGWSTTENGTTAAQDIASTPVTSAVTYYAIWTPTEYTISYFDADGTTAINQEPANYTIETDDITLTAPTKEGYTFEGWYDNAEYHGDAITSIAKGSTGNKTFYAKWSKVDTSISYTVVPELVSDSGTSEGTTALASGTVDEGTASVTVTGLPIVVKEDDKYYILSTDASETFQRTLDLTGDKEQKLKVRYTLDETIIAYTELEDLGLGDETISETSSGGKYGYVHSDGGTKIIASGIAAGTYSCTVSVRGKDATGASWRFYLSSTEVNTWKNDNPTYPYSFTGNVTIGSDGQLKISPYKSGSTLYNSVDIDYIIVREPNTVTDYTVKAVTPEDAEIAEITTGITKTASAVSGLPEVVQDSDGKYYRISDNLVAENSHTKNITKKLTDGDTVNVKYTLDENMIFFIEGENFENKKASPNATPTNITYSGGSSHQVAYNKTSPMGTITYEAGTYLLEGYIVAVPEKGFRLKDSSDANAASFTPSETGTYKSQFTLSKATTLSLKGGTTQNNDTPMFDYIIISKVTE